MTVQICRREFSEGELVTCESAGVSRTGNTLLNVTVTLVSERQKKYLQRLEHVCLNLRASVEQPGPETACGLLSK